MATDGVDLDLLRAVRTIRIAKGACTVRDVAAVLKLSVGGTQNRVDRAINVGLLERSDVAGSLRVTLEAGKVHQMHTAGGLVVDVIVTAEGEILDARVELASA